jgi:putative inorganic carbon (HCO3(-)) transporter
VRDVLLTVIVAGLLPLIFWRPAVGAYAWAWLSIMNPHMLAYGFARAVPFAMVVAIVTMLACAFSNQRKPLPINGGTVLLMLMIGWMTLTSFFALNTPELVWERWLFGIKIFVMLFVTLMLLRGRAQIDLLVWVIVFSVAFYGVKGGIWTVLTGGGGRVWGPPGGMIAGNNELAVALVVLMPWMYYLYASSARRLVKYALLLSMAACAFAILGTQSRGALLGLVSMALFLGLKGDHPVRTTLAMLALVSAAVAFMPDSWTQRMETVQAYETDSSAMGRIYTWQTLWNAALDRPLVGAGFRADNALVFARYAPFDAQSALNGAVFVAHSVYFQALGEHGFPGLLLYLGLGVWTWVAAGRLARATADAPEFQAWVPLLMRMCQVSLLGFAVGGAFLSLMLLDLPYYIVAVVVLVQATVSEAEQARRSAAHTRHGPSNQGAPNHVVTGRSPA